MKIEWQKAFPDADYSPLCGEDENGVRYTLSANQETVTAVLPDGRAGAGWTEAEALQSALAQTPPGEHPADLRERMRALLVGLHDAARGVYARENLQTPELPVFQVAETVLYSFDADNRRAVAAALGLDYAEMCALLVGYVLGYEDSVPQDGAPQDGGL